MASVAHELRQYKGHKTLRTVAAELGLPESSIGLMSKMLRGHLVSPDSERMIGRALGVLPPARTIPRVTPNKAQRERQAALGVAWHDILEKGLECWEAQNG